MHHHGCPKKRASTRKHIGACKWEHPRQQPSSKYLSKIEWVEKSAFCNPVPWKSHASHNQSGSLHLSYKNRNDSFHSEKIRSHLMSQCKTLSKRCLLHGKTREDAYTLHNKDTSLRPFLSNKNPIIHFLYELSYICQNLNGDGECNSMQSTAVVSIIGQGTEVAKICLSQSPSSLSFMYE